MKTILWLLAMWGGASVLVAQDISEDPSSSNLTSSAVHSIQASDNHRSIPDLEAMLIQNPAAYEARIQLVEAYLQDERYEDAREGAELAISHPKRDGRSYQLMGQALVGLNDTRKALKTYEKGIKQFPQLAELYLELGELEWARGNHQDAIQIWEAGLEAIPDFTSLYYQLVQAFQEEDFYLWSIMYGEMLWHLEPNSARARILGGTLFEIYQQAIPLGNTPAGGSLETGFVPQDLPAATLSELLNGFPGAFNLNATTTCALIFRQTHTLGLKEIVTFKEMFIRTWYANGNASTHPNAILSFWKRASKAGHLEAYTYWMHAEGDPASYQAWAKANADKMEAFLGWFEANQLQTKGDKGFHRLRMH